MTNKELIAEARQWANGHPNRRSGELMGLLADALEAATCEPSGGDRERIAAILQLRHPGNMWSTCERDADAILAAVLPSSGIDEAALAEVIGAHKLVHVAVSRKSAFCACDPSVTTGTDGNSAWFEAHRARAVAAWLKDGGAKA